MATVNTTEIARVYQALITEHKLTLDEEFSEGKLTGDQYAAMLNQAMQQAMSLAVQTTQQQELIDEQVLKLQADTSFVEAQETELTASVIYNNKIKALTSYGNALGTMMAGGLVASTEMWGTYFNMLADLNSSAVTPANTTVVKAT